MDERFIEGRSIPWDELQGFLSGEDWWLEKVRGLEKVTGYDDGVLRLSMMATFNCCRYHADFPNNLLRACEAIGEGEACAGKSCCHVRPERWRRANEYVAAIQGWLTGLKPQQIADDGSHDEGSVSRVYSMLGRPTPHMEALLSRYLFTLISRLKWATNFHALGDTPPGELDLLFRDYEALYLTEGDVPYYELTVESPEIAELDLIITREIPDGEQWISQIDTPEQPLCHQRYLRHQDVKISSIGCGIWRGALPPNPMPREKVLGLITSFDEALRAWSTGGSLGSPAFKAVSSLLGEATPVKRAIVEQFMLYPLGSVNAYYWLKELDRPEAERDRGY
jgi:hypothetical protein